MLASLEPIGPSGGHSDPRNGIDPAWESSTWHGSVADGPVETMKQVREHMRRGADVIKIMPSGGVLSIGDDPKAQLMTNDEIKAAIDTAHALGLKVAAHAHGKAAIDNAVRLGIDSIEHGTYADAESFKLFVQHGTIWFQLLVADQVNQTARLHPRPPSILQRKKPPGHPMKHSSFEAYVPGSKIAFGTDTETGANAHEFAPLVEAGMTPVDAPCRHPQRGTSGRRDTQGSIQPGRFADLIAVKGNPFSDITEMERVQFVMKGGVVFKIGGASVPQPLPAAALSTDMEDF
jgi:imidazolonepropionase-like amidohydrolase